MPDGDGFAVAFIKAMVERLPIHTIEFIAFGMSLFAALYVVDGKFEAGAAARDLIEPLIWLIYGWLGMAALLMGRIFVQRLFQKS